MSVNPNEGTPLEKGGKKATSLENKEKKEVKHIGDPPPPLPPKNKHTLRIATQNIQKGVDDKIMQLANALSKLEIDILLTQEWGGWQNEETRYKKIVTGYTNFCSFKAKKGFKHDNVSMLAMSIVERNKHRKKNTNKRKRGTTILIKDNLINQLNINEIKTNKDGEIEIIEMTIDKEKTIIINIHAEPNRDQKKKDKFYKKLETIIDNNLNKEANIIIGGDANSVWKDEDTSNIEKEGLDKSIHDFCKKRGYTDLMHKHRKRKIPEKEDTNEGTEKRKNETHTWERESSGLTKRLDSFWGKKSNTERTLGAYTLHDEWITSDHNLAIIDWDTKAEIKRETTTDTTKIIVVDNKKMGELLTKRDWDEYKKGTEKDITEDTTIQTINSKIQKRDEITEEDLTTTIHTIEKIINKNLHSIYTNTKKREEDKEKEKEEKRLTEEEETGTVEKDKSFLESLNLRAFENPDYKHKPNQPNKEQQKLPKGIDGPTAKLIRIKQRVIRFQKFLQRTLLGKKEWLAKDLVWAESLAELSPKLQIRDPSNKTNITQAKEEARRISNGLARIIYKRKNKYRRIELNEAIENYEAEGWKSSKKFFNKILKKFKERHSIRKIPAKYLEEGQNDTDPNNIKQMIQKFWSKLYSSEDKIADNQYTEDNRPWFNTENWKKHREEIENNTTLNELMTEIDKTELEETIRKLKNNKTGGPDGITNEQIKYGPTNLWNILQTVMNKILKNKKIPPAWKEMKICTIFKKDDSNDPDKYRGIALSATLYKILAKILAKRLANKASSLDIIDPAQGVGKLGFASYNEARTLHNIIEDANQFDQEIHICYIDLTKAYDLVERWSLDEILSNIGIPQDFKDLMIDINTNIQATIDTDFGQTDKFTISRGLRQGCPLSPLLFCLVIEPLLRWIGSENKGYEFAKNNNLSTPILAYMDDIVLISKSKEEMKSLITKLETFCDFYGMKISDKSVYTYKKKKSEENEEEPDEETIIQGVSKKHQTTQGIQIPRLLDHY
jgi:exonuclease III